MTEEEVSTALLLHFFEDLLRGALGGAAEELATTTMGTFLSTPGGQEWRAFSAPSSENTRLTLFLCFTRFL
jgi:hypothetical protein